MSVVVRPRDAAGVKLGDPLDRGSLEQVTTSPAEDLEVQHTRW